MRKNVRGFTLIELLVVIAIIGVLASIVLVSLTSARTKGREARIASDVQQLRLAVQQGFNGFGYADLNATNASCSGSAAITGNLATNANCVITGGPSSSLIQQLVSDATFLAGPNSVFFLTSVSGSNVVNYAIRARMIANPNVFFCIDSRGDTNQADNNVVTGATCH